MLHGSQVFGPEFVGACILGKFGFVRSNLDEYKPAKGKCLARKVTYKEIPSTSLSTDL